MTDFTELKKKQRATWALGEYDRIAPINALYDLHEALVMLQEEGLQNSWARHTKNHLALRAGLDAMGLKFVIPESVRLPQLNALTIPDGVDDAAGSTWRGSSCSAKSTGGRFV